MVLFKYTTLGLKTHITGTKQTKNQRVISYGFWEKGTLFVRKYQIVH